MKKVSGIYIGFIVGLAIVEKITSMVFNGLTLCEGFCLLCFPAGMIWACFVLAIILSKALRKEAYRFPKHKLDSIYFLAVFFYPFLLLCEFIIDRFFFSSYLSFSQFILVRIDCRMIWLNYAKYKMKGTVVTVSQISLMNWGLFFGKWFLLTLLMHKTIKEDLRKCPFSEKYNVYYDVMEIKRGNEINRTYLLNLMPKNEREQVVGDFYVYYCVVSGEGFIQYKKGDNQLYSFDLTPDQVVKISNRDKACGKNRWMYYSASEKVRQLEILRLGSRIFLGLTVFWIIFSIVVTINTMPFPVEVSKAVITDRVFEKYVTSSKMRSTYKKYKYYCIYKRKNGTYQKGYITNRECYEDWKVGDKITVYYSPDIKNGEEVVYNHDIGCTFLLWGFVIIFFGIWVFWVREANCLKKSMQDDK